MDFFQNILSKDLTFTNSYLAVFRIIAPLLALLLLWRCCKPLLTFRREPEIWGFLCIKDGKKQAITETFGCCGWNISPAELKRVAGFQYACGVNMMCHHLLPYSEHGQRKKDYPAHFNPINPWIKEHFKEFNDYFSRLGYLLSNSEEPVNVAMLHPMRSAYFNY